MTRFLKVRTLTAADKALLALSLSNHGVKARIRQFRGSLRVVIISGTQDDTLAAINDNGFLNPVGEKFTRFSFNGAVEIHVHYMAA